MPALVEFGSDDLSDTCLGLFFAQTSSGSWRIFAGTEASLEELVAGSWTDRTRSGGPYTTTEGNKWRAAKWGDFLIAVNGTDEPQYIDVNDGSSTEFDDLPDSNAPIARDIGIAGDFVVLTDAVARNRLVWCGTNGPIDAAGWTTGTALCDEYIAPDGGNIATAPMLGEYGVFLQEGDIARRLVLQRGDPATAFVVEKLEAVKGSVTPYGAIAAQGKIYYRGQGAFYVMTADGQNQQIDKDRVRRWFLDNTDQSRTNQIVGFADPYSSRIMWTAYASEGSTAYDRQLIYDTELDRWSYGVAEAAFFAPVVTAGLTLEEVAVIYPDIDDMPLSLDSPQFQGGKPVVAGVTAGGMLAFQTGESMEAVFEIAESEINQDGWTYIPEVSPIGKWGNSSATLRIGLRDYSGAAQAFIGPYSRDDETGLYYTDIASRIFAFELTIPAGGSWVLAQGLRTVDRPYGGR
jgi:hypothetical protein